MSRYCQWVLIFVVSVFNFCLDANAQIGTNKDVMESNGDFEGFLRDLGSMVYKAKTPKSVTGSQQNVDLAMRTTPKISPSFAFNTQKAALNDVLMLKLVSYYEDKYKLVHHEPTTKRSSEPDIFYSTYFYKDNEMGDLNHHKSQHSTQDNSPHKKDDMSVMYAANEGFSKTNSAEKVEHRAPDIEAMLDDMSFVVDNQSKEKLCYNEHRPSSVNKLYRKTDCKMSGKQIHKIMDRKIVNEREKVLRKENHKSLKLEKVYNQADNRPSNEKGIGYRKDDYMPLNFENVYDEVDHNIPYDRGQVYRNDNYRRPIKGKIYDEFEHIPFNVRGKVNEATDKISQNIPIHLDRRYENVPDSRPDNFGRTYNFRPIKSDKNNEKVKDNAQNVQSGYTNHDTIPQEVEDILDDITKFVPDLKTGYNEAVDTTQEIMQYFDYDVVNDKQTFGEVADYIVPDIAIL